MTVAKTAEDSAAATQLLVEPRPNRATSLLQKISVAPANSCWDVRVRCLAIINQYSSVQGAVFYQVKIWIHIPIISLKKSISG